MGAVRVARRARSVADPRLREAVYFELHKLWSEQQRLKQMRAVLNDRIQSIDARLAEIDNEMGAVDPARSSEPKAEVKPTWAGRR